MGIVLKNNKLNIFLSSNIINGIITNNNLLSLLDKKNISFISKDYNFYTNSVLYEMNIYYKKDNFNNIINILLKEFGLDNSFLEKKINDLSSGDKKILKYLLMLLDNKKILVIDEPFLDLDYCHKKRIISIFKKIINHSNKTIIIISNNSDLIYSLCDKVLFINNYDTLYGDISLFHNKEILDKYKVEEPLIVKFINYVKEKKVLINYSKDIRDLIKDVYKSV